MPLSTLISEQTITKVSRCHLQQVKQETRNQGVGRQSSSTELVSVSPRDIPREPENSCLGLIMQHEQPMNQFHLIVKSM